MAAVPFLVVEGKTKKELDEGWIKVYEQFSLSMESLRLQHFGSGESESVQGW